MLIIVDKRIPAEAKEKLKEVGSRQSAVGSQDQLSHIAYRSSYSLHPASYIFNPASASEAVVILELETNGLTYPAISGHPDIFFCKTPQTLVVSPNLPEKYFSLLRKHTVHFITGHLASGIRHPDSERYNAAINEKYLVHRLEYTDPVILESCHYLKKIPVKQGYTRCNLLLLKKDNFITSDAGIFKTLNLHGMTGLCVSPEGIALPGFPNGFIGGTMGLFENTVFVVGHLGHFREGGKIREFLENLEYGIVELYDGPLVDGGGILFC